MLSDFILNSRFVDDQGHSEENKAALKKLVKAADNLFGQVGLKCKGWTYSWGSATLLAKVILLLRICVFNKIADMTIPLLKLSKIVCGEEIENIDPKRFNPRRFHPIRNRAGIS